MFPDAALYYGLDISKTRLASSVNKKHSSDILLLADLTQSFECRNFFDAVVSLNTLSHLTPDSQTIAISNLIQLCKPGGSFFVNFDLSIHHMNLMPLLMSSYDSIEVIYFDSFLSQQSENSGLVDISSVKPLTITNEFNLPNDACFHKQVLISCSDKKPSQDTSCVSPQSIVDHTNLPFIQLTPIPNVKISYLPNDHEAILLVKGLAHTSTILFTSKLFNSSYGSSFKHLFPDSLIISELSDDILPLNSHYFVFGLEQEWTSNEAVDRKYINKLRNSTPSVSLTLVFVSERDNKTCNPSLIAGDY